MKVKQFFIVAVGTFLLSASFTGCTGGLNDIAEKEPADGVLQKFANEKASVSEEIVGEDGERFEADLSVYGRVASEAADLDSSTIVLRGKAYDFPMRVSELMDNGWHFSENGSFDNAFKPKVTTSLITFYMYNGGTEIMLNKVYNDSDDVAKIEDCLLLGLSIGIDYDEGAEPDCEFILPGGIIGYSTAADVLSVMGDPNKTKAFDYGYNSDYQLSYREHKISGLSYNFSFQDPSWNEDEDSDGYLLSVKIEAER